MLSHGNTAALFWVRRNQDNQLLRYETDSAVPALSVPSFPRPGATRGSTGRSDLGSDDVQ